MTHNRSTVPVRLRDKRRRIHDTTARSTRRPHIPRTTFCLYIEQSVISCCTEAKERDSIDDDFSKFSPLYLPLYSAMVFPSPKPLSFYSHRNKSTDETIPPIPFSVTLPPLEYCPLFHSNRLAIFFSD